MARKKLARTNHSIKPVVKKTRKKVTVPALSAVIKKTSSRSHAENTQPEDTGWLKASEPSFEFWNNPEDSEYDKI